MKEKEKTTGARLLSLEPSTGKFGRMKGKGRNMRPSKLTCQGNSLLVGRIILFSNDGRQTVSFFLFLILRPQHSNRKEVHWPKNTMKEKGSGS